ncbi:MAG: hypothetical protein FJ264_13340 [Planctomycetes bacterium]|nr:hypothetical protein [Planctomycetota bacterium]
MTPNQLEEAQKLALNWKPEQGQQKKGGKSSLLKELFTATRDGDEKKVKELLDAGGDPNTEIGKGIPLLFVAVNENRLPVVKALVEAGANVNAAIEGDMTILMIAIQKGHDDIAHYLIEKGADVNAKSQNGATPLSLAREGNREDVVKHLLKAGAKDEQKKEEVTLSIFDAAAKGDVDAIKGLLKSGVKPDDTDGNGMFPLLFASLGGHKEAVEMLLQSRADINKKTRDGGTALMAAALNGHKAVIELLLEKGADISIKNKDGVTAKIIAEQKGYREIASLLSGNILDTEAGMEFIFVEGGCFQMGDTFGDGDDDEKPVHRVCVGDYYIGTYEVTQGQWESVMGSNPSHFKKGENYPVETVSWNDVQDFIERLNKQTGKQYRLPTEVEWEYAARSGGKNEKWAGTNQEYQLGSYAWYVENSGSTTHPVGQKQSNGLGLYDMSGNVWEWCSDWYGGDYYKNSPTNNPQGPSSGSDRVYRGGSWFDYPRYVRASNRCFYTPESRNHYLGFRLARTP